MSTDPLAPLNIAAIPRLALREVEAAEALGVSPSWLRREAKAGRVPSALVAGCRLYPVDAIRSWLNEQVQQAGQETGGDA